MAPKQLTKAEEAKAAAAAEKKAIDALWKAAKNDAGKAAEAAIEKLPSCVGYADEQVSLEQGNAAIAGVLTVPDCTLCCCQYGHTALHRAAAFGALSVMRVLYKHGASLEVKNRARETPLDTAKSLGNNDATKLLEAFAQGVHLPGQGLSSWPGHVS